MSLSEVGGGLWVPVAEIARRSGISRQAAQKNVRKWERDGALATKPGPRGTILVNQVVYDRLRRTIADPAQDLRNGKDGALDLEDDAPTPGEDAGAPTRASYHASRAEREAYQAENARLDLEERLGSLCDRDDVERRVMATFRRVRDSLLALPATVAERVAAAPDARAVRALLQAEFRRVLEALAADLDSREAGDDDDDRELAAE